MLDVNCFAVLEYVQSLAEGLHRELASSNADVLASAPGPVNSGFGGRADKRMGNADTSAKVAIASLKALGRKATVIPGNRRSLVSSSRLSQPRIQLLLLLALECYQNKIALSGKVLRQMELAILQVCGRQLRKACRIDFTLVHVSTMHSPKQHGRHQRKSRSRKEWIHETSDWHCFSFSVCNDSLLCM